MISRVGARVNETLNSVVSKVVGGVLFGKFVGDYSLVLSKRAFGDVGGALFQPAADKPFLAGIGVAVALIACGAVLERLTRRFGDAVEEVAETVGGEVDEDG